MRNTTKFNVSNKIVSGGGDAKKPEEESKFGLSSTIKHCKSTNFMPKFLKEEDKVKNST